MIRGTTLALFAFAVTLTGPAAAQNPAASPKPTAPTSATAKPPMHKVKEAQPGLLKQAKVTETVAEQAALASVPGGKVTTREIERQKGALIYAFHIKTEGQEGYQAVTVDAMNGTVVSNLHQIPMKAATTKKPLHPDSSKRKPPQH
jgi:hypothetical protein